LDILTQLKPRDYVGRLDGEYLDSEIIDGIGQFLSGLLRRWRCVEVECHNSNTHK